MAQRWRDWLAQAKHDLQQAAASRNDGRHDWACFAAHQASEKAVKALHVLTGKRARGHVVARLLSELPEALPEHLVEKRAGARQLLRTYTLPKLASGRAGLRTLRTAAKRSGTAICR